MPALGLFFVGGHVVWNLNDWIARFDMLAVGMRSASAAALPSAAKLVERFDDAFDCRQLRLVEVRFATLCADPCRCTVEMDVIAIPINFQGRFSAMHGALAVDAVHRGLRVRPNRPRSR